MSTNIDFYKGLDRDSKLVLSLDIPTLAARVCDLNYGAHRFLSALVHELRRRQSNYVTESNERYEKEGKRPLWKESDKVSRLADAIEDALNAGHTH